MHINSKLAKSIRLALMFGATATAMTGVAQAQEQSDEEAAEERVERIQVTGSRLSRADLEGALPVVVFDRATIDASGDISVADFIRDTAGNSFGSYQSSSGGSFAGFSGVSLRGLGEGRTLILVDGRRAPTAPQTGGSQDLNSIPLAAVERIEVLSAGASAIYGSDALGGVVNIITRKDFEGVQATYGIGRPDAEGGDTEEFSLIMGASGERGRIVAGASMNWRDTVYTRDRDYWYRTRAGSTFSNNFSLSTSTAAASRLQHPEYGTAVPGLCTNGDDSDLFWFNEATRNCQFDHAATSANLTSVRNYSVFSNGDYEINNDWTLYSSTSVTKSESKGRYAPVPSSPFPGGAISLPAGSPNHPATNPDNGGLNPEWDDPYYQDLADTDLFMFHRFAALGNRDSLDETTTHNLLMGVEGRVGNINLDAGFRYSQARAVSLGYNYVVGGLAQAAITSGAYNVYDPFDGDPQSLGFTATILRDMKTSVKEFYFSGDMDLFQLPGGIAAVAFGAEYREEYYQDNYDPLSSSGQIVGSAGNSAAGDRDVTAVYAEALLPVLADLEISVAGRYDEYSDYGSDFSPMVGVRYQPLENLTIRGTYGKGFRAPSLSILTQQPSFSAAFTSDRETCIMMVGQEACSVQVSTYSIANPNLDSENSTQYGLGVAWQPTDWLNLTFDYYNIEITNQISSIGIGTVIGCFRELIDVCPPGITQFPSGSITNAPDQSLGLGVELDPDTGGIVYAQTGAGNLGKTNTDGFDVSANMNFDFGSMGTLNTSITGSYVENYSGSSGVNVTGRAGYPRIRAGINNSWAYGDFNVAWNISYIHSTESNVYRLWLTDSTWGAPALEEGLDTGLTFGDYSEGLQGKEIDAHIIHNLQVNYNAPWNATVTFGVRNLTDEDPKYDNYYQTYGSDTVDTYLYDPWGRTMYVRYTQRF
ncbi:TonB-dependent receptor [Aliidiomarina celeris]|uniref:TonB-dependent receptor n=1 Tax=Aliidiomarina celeris TaxID=2249428 RepID=UPI000DE97BAF|nr:TonB-dependent receptor [Aliidiomarina celeris]